MITLARLRQVITLAEHRSFARAAQTLGLSQPALTKSIQALEAALGVRLFDRLPRGVVPTEFGHLVISHTQDMVAREVDLLRDIQLLAGLEVGNLRLAVGPVPAVMSGHAALGNLLARKPALQVTLRLMYWREVTRAVADRTVELGLADLSDAATGEHFDTEEVGRHRSFVVCRRGHPLSGQGALGLDQLLRFPWAHTRMPPRIASGLPRTPCPAGRIDEFSGDFVPAVEVTVPTRAADLLRNNDLLAVGPLGMVEHDLEAGRLVVLPTPDLGMRSSYGFIYRRNRSLSPAAQAFMQAVREEEVACAEREQRLALRHGAT